MTKREKKPLFEKFNRAVKKAGLVSAAGLSLLFGGCATPARAHTAEIAPLVSAAETLPANQNTEVKTDARLDSILAKTRATADGRALLDYVAKCGIKVELSDSKVMDDDPDDGLFVQGLNRYTLIQLNREVSSDESLMLTLAHEVRHSWHKREIKTGDLNVDPKRGWISDRIQEADCFAYEIHFGYEYEKATGKSLGLESKFGSYGEMTRYYAGLRDGGMAADEAYCKLLDKTFKHVHGLKYDDDFLDRQINRWNSVVEKPVIGILYEKSWNSPTSDADFAATMRRVTTVGLDTAKDTSALKNWKDADFLDLTKTGGLTKEDSAKLATADLKFEAARVAWTAYWKEVMDKIKVEATLPKTDIQPAIELPKIPPKPPGPVP